MCMDLTCFMICNILQYISFLLKLFIMACWRRIPIKVMYITGVETSHRVHIVQTSQLFWTTGARFVSQLRTDITGYAGLAGRGLGRLTQRFRRWTWGSGDLPKCKPDKHVHNRLCIRNIYIAYYDIHFVCGNTHLHYVQV